MTDKEKMDAYKACSSLDELINVEFGEHGTPSRDLFDAETKEFCIAQTLREERLRAGLTQEELAERVGTKKTYISRVENGKQNLNVATLYRLFECLGKRVAISVF